MIQCQSYDSPFQFFPPQMMTTTRGFQYTSVIQNFPVMGYLFVQPQGSDAYATYQNLSIPQLSSSVALPSSFQVSNQIDATATDYLSAGDGVCQVMTESIRCTGWASTGYSWSNSCTAGQQCPFESSEDDQVTVEMYLRVNPLKANSPATLTLAYSTEDQTTEIEYYFQSEVAHARMPVNACADATCQPAEQPTFQRNFHATIINHLKNSLL